MRIHGATRIDQSSQIDYVINGHTTIGSEATRLQLNRVEINGSASIDNASINTLIIHGSAKLSRVEVTGEACFSGALRLTDCRFLGNVMLRMPSLVAVRCAFMRDVLFKKNPFLGRFKQGRLELKDHSQVAGNVCFAGRGKLIVDETSRAESI